MTIEPKAAPLYCDECGEEVPEVDVCEACSETRLCSTCYVAQGAVCDACLDFEEDDE